MTTTFNTGNPIGSTKAKDLSDNASNFDDAILLTSDTWVDRLGVTRDTVNGRIKKMGFAVPVTYGAGISFATNDNVKTVDEGGIIYAPLPASLPFNTSGVWGGDDDDRFFVVQGLTDAVANHKYTPNFTNIANLKIGNSSNGDIIDMTTMIGARVFWRGYYAESDGGSNWGVVKSGAHTEDGGSIFSIDANTYVEANLKGKAVNVKKFGAKGDGANIDRPHIQAVIDAEYSPYLPKGNFDLDGSLIFNDKTSIYGLSPIDAALRMNADAHCIVIPFNTDQRREKKLITGFTIKAFPVTVAKYAIYFNGTDITNSAVKFNIGYTIRDVDINTGVGQFAGGIRAKDTFRLNIDNVGMTGVTKSLSIIGQCVQTNVRGLISNADPTDTQFGAGRQDNIGLESLPSTEYFGGEVGVPEGVYVSYSFFVNHKQGFYGGALSATINNCEFDIYTGPVGVEFLSIGLGSNFIFRDNWVSPSSQTTGNAFGNVGTVGILKQNNTLNTESIVIDGNTIIAGGALPTNSIAICVGWADNSPFVESQGTVITSNQIKSSGSNKWAYGINADRNRSIRIQNNTVYGDSTNGSCCSVADISLTLQKYTTCTHNDCYGQIVFSSFAAEGYGEVAHNKCSSFSNASGGSYIPRRWNLTGNNGSEGVIAATKLETAGSVLVLSNNSTTFDLSAQTFGPRLDAVSNIAQPSFRVNNIYLANSPIVTSDAKTKEVIGSLDDAEKRVALAIKANLKTYRLKSSVIEKGNNARIHTGVIAQDVVLAFESEGLNARDYGLLCYDEWGASEDADGITTEAGNLYGIRYEQLLCFIISAM